MAEARVTMQTDLGESVDFFVLEETRINGKNYLLVTDATEDEDGECYVLKDMSPEGDAQAAYEFVEDEDELEGLFDVFSRLMDDTDVKLEK